MQPGRAATVEHTVTDTDTAIALGSGDVPVLGTPRVVAIAEEASIRALGGSLPDGSTSVGTRVELAHLMPVSVGTTVKCEATLERVEGKRLVFTVAVHSERGLVAAGKVTRVVVDRQQFLDKAK